MSIKIKHLYFFLFGLGTLIVVSLSGCSDSVSTDILAPTLELYGPFSNDTVVVGQTRINFSAYDDQGIKSVNVFVNNTFQKSYSDANGYQPDVFLELGDSYIDQRINYHITVVDIAGNIKTSPERVNILVIESKVPPSPAFDLKVQKITDRTINISWKDTSSHTKKRALWRRVSTSTKFDSIKAIASGSFNTNDDLPNTSLVYYYKIGSYNSAGVSYSEQVSSVANSGGGTVVPPSNLVATALGTNKIKLTWKDNANNENYYKVERKLYGSFEAIAFLQANSSSYLDSANGLVTGREYGYRVKAISDADSAWSDEVTVSTFPYDLTAPSNLTVSKIGTTKARLTWTAGTIASQINISVERKTGSLAYQEIVLLGSTGQNLYDDTTVSAPNSYTYRVRVTDGTYTSPYSNTASITFTIPLTAPGNLTATAISGTKIKLDWIDNSSNEDFFKIEHSTGFSDFYLLTTVVANTTTFTDTTLSEGSTMYYRIKAYAGLDSAVSNTANATTPVTPVTPTNLLLTKMSATTVRVSWNSQVSSQIFVEIERSITNTSSFVKIGTVGTIATNYFDDMTVSAPNTYFYRIRTSNGTVHSSYTDPQSITLP